MCFDFLPEVPDIKIQILFWGPNFFAPNWRIDEANWKIDTISVVQETNTNLEKSELVSSRKNSTLDKFDYSELSYKFLFTTKSLILAQDER